MSIRPSVVLFLIFLGIPSSEELASGAPAASNLTGGTSQEVGEGRGTEAGKPMSLPTIKLAQPGRLAAPKDEQKKDDELVLNDEAEALNGLLARIAKEQSLDPEDFLHLRAPAGGGSYFARETRLRTVRSKQVDYMLAIQCFVPNTKPGTIGDQVVLMDKDGKILDRLQCSIREDNDGSDLTIQIFRNEEPDGAQVVIRYLGHVRSVGGKEIPAWYHEGHTVGFHGRDYAFAQDDEILTAVPRDPDNWAVKGICRAKISDGKFAILYPNLERPDDELLTAKSLHVKYYPANAENPYKWENATFDNDRDVKALLSTIRLHSTVRCDLGIGNSSTIEFRLPNGSVKTIAFKSPSLLLLDGWGYLELDSRDFYDRLCAILSKRGGTSVKFADVSEPRI